jgi:cell filamentation protein
MTSDPYVDPVSGVLTNKLGITDADVLRQVTADISAARLDEIAARPMRGMYDLIHLRAMHRRIFGDIFAWAGQIRTIPIFKETGFCLPQHIESYAADEFAKLAREQHLRGLDRERFAERIAYYHAEINELHPFREGNGRAQRAFLGQLAGEAGYRLDWTAVGAQDNLEAAIAAHNGDLEPLRRIMLEITILGAVDQS